MQVNEKKDAINSSKKQKFSVIDFYLSMYTCCVRLPK